MKRAAVLLAAVSCVTSRRVVRDDMIFDDLQSLSSWGGNLWPNPTSIPYSITASAALPSNDERVLTAVGIIEARTCLRFRIATNADTEYIRVINAATTGTCLANIGRVPGRITSIEIGSRCGTGAVLHEFLHALGFFHEQSRNDRNEFVTVNEANVQPSLLSNFALESNAFDIGAYDYNSIMHYSATAFARSPGLITVTSPQPIGQRSTLSTGDAASIQFLYQSCAVPTAPTCLLTKTGTVNIPYGKEFSVSSIGTYSQQLALSGSVTAARQNTPLYRTYRYTPPVGDVGRSRDVNFVYTAADNTAVTCSMRVTVLDATEVCFGQGGAEACSGTRGTCTSGGCQCTGNFGGPTCAAFNTCPHNAASDFEDGTSNLLNIDAANGISIITTDSYSGLQSLSVSSTGSSYAFTGVPRRVSARVKFTHFANGGGLYMWRNNVICISFQPARLTIGNRVMYRYAGGNTNLHHYLVDPWKWQLLEVEVIPGSGRPVVNYYADGALVSTGNFDNTACDAGITHTGAIFPDTRNSLVDDFKVTCSQFVSIRGTVVDGTSNQQTLLRSGGGTLILFLQGDTWKSDATSIQTVLDSLKGRRDDSQWETNRATLLVAANVVVSGSTMTITLGAVANYDSQLDDVITFNPPTTVTTDGLGFVRTTSFEIRGWCAYAKVFQGTAGFYLGNGGTRYAPNSVKFVIPVGQSTMTWEIADRIQVRFTSQSVCISSSCGTGPTLPSTAAINIDIEFTRSTAENKAIQRVTVKSNGGSVLDIAWPAAASVITDATYISASPSVTQTFICPTINPQIKHMTISVNSAASTSSGTFVVIPGSIQLESTDMLLISEDAACTQRTAYTVRPSNGQFELTYQGRRVGTDYWVCYNFGATGTSFVQAFPWMALPPTPIPQATAAPGSTPTPVPGTVAVQNNVVVEFQIASTSIAQVVSSITNWAQQLRTILGSAALPVCEEIQVLTQQTGQTVWVVTGTLDCSGVARQERVVSVLEETSYKPKYRGTSTRSQSDIKVAVDSAGNTLAAVAGGTYVGSTVAVTPVPTSTSSPSSDDNTMVIAIAAGVGGGVVLIIAIIVGCYCCKSDDDNEREHSKNDPY